MHLRCVWRPLTIVLIAASAALSACGGNDAVAPPKNVPARLDAVSDLVHTVMVGASIPGGIVVKVTDSTGRASAGVTVGLVVTLGNGSVNPAVAVTNSDGEATAAWTAGTIVGPNEVAASVVGVAGQIKFDAAGTAGAVVSVALSSANIRLPVNVDTARIIATSLDAFGNATTPAPTLTIRDPSQITLDGSGLIHAASRGSHTYIVAAASGKSDSVLVTLLAPGQSICTGVAAPAALAVGQVITDNVAGSGFCVHATDANAEYAIIPYFNSDVPSATTQIEVLGQGLTSLPLPRTSLAVPAVPALPAPALTPDYAFESRLRSRERVESATRMPAARAWYGARRDVVADRAPTITVPAVGDLIKLNANGVDFCDNPDIRTARVMAVTNKAIVVADTTNPAGGFTSDEYRSIGVTFDTLINPTDTAAFGAPTDIDNNGHVILFFTRAVNELTASGSGSVVLGFFYRRDLYPKVAAPGPCPGSNVGELFYLLVPDIAGVVNGNVRTKAQVVTVTNGTVAHEYQHLINASRRMYVNGAGTNFEEAWLDEGLAHTAEELNFWKASGLSPRTNVDYAATLDPKVAAAYATFEYNNHQRYATYLFNTAIQSPIGVNSTDDDLPTRGAIWSFLRYAADHLPAGTENAFWFKLVNSTTTGVANLTAALGSAPNTMLRNWAISVFMDDDAVNVDPRFLQPSWNLRSVLTADGSLITFPLATHLMADGAATIVPLSANGVSILRFSVPAGADALLSVTAGGQALPSNVQLAIVRVK